MRGLWYGVNMQHIQKIIDSTSVEPRAQTWSPFSNPLYRKEAKARRRTLRKNATPQEIMLWVRLRSGQLGKKFRRQHSVGPYIVDFYCTEKKCVIEIDGSQHFDESAVRYDKQRTRFLESQGCTVLRFSNDEINTNIEGVLLRIAEQIDEI